MNQERDVGETEHRPLLIGLAEEADDLRAAGLQAHPRGSGFVDVPGRDEVEDNRNQPSVLDAFVVGGWVVDCDPYPEDLSQLEPTAWRVEPLIHFIDLV